MKEFNGNFEDVKPKDIPSNQTLEKAPVSTEARGKFEEITGLDKIPICDDKPKGIIAKEVDNEHCDDNGKPYRTNDGGWIPNNTYELDGSVYKTDDNGNIYSIDGELQPEDVFVLDGKVYTTDEDGMIVSIEKADEGKALNREIDKSDEGNDVKEAQPIQNKIDGMAREKEVEEELKEKYPESEGYEILSEVYLRDKDGNIVRDPETGEARRIDFVVVKDGKVVDSVEVTSKTADKTEQTAKEERIRDEGGNYVRDNNGNLVEIPKDVTTRIERRD